MPIHKYNNLKSNSPELIDANWGRSGIKHSSLHSISSYLAMFAPALPEYFIERYSNKGDLIMDPFSGRGTTALRAREKNRRFVGSDLNPYALVLSRLKVSTLKKKDLINKINKLEMEFEKWNKKNMNIYRRVEYSELNIYYSPSILRSLIFLRKTLGANWRKINQVDNALLAFTLGIMHGPSKKDGSSIYLSLGMSNTISMSPNYVKKYAKKNNLKKPKNYLFDKLRNRIHKKYDEILHVKFKENLFEFDAIKNNYKIKNNSVKLLITSPPYLSIVNYTQSNWIKLWLLGYSRKNLRNEIKLSDNLKFDEYVVFITAFLKNVYSKIAIGGHVCLIVGDVKSRKLIEDVWEIINDNVRFKFVEIFYDSNYSQNKKVLNTMNERKGQATMIEKVLVLKK